MNLDYIVFLSFMGTGAIAGSLSGLLGIGGGIVVVPILSYIFGRIGINETLLMHMVIGSSITAMIATTASSAYAHLNRGATVWPVYKRLVLGVVIGVVMLTTGFRCCGLSVLICNSCT